MYVHTCVHIEEGEKSQVYVYMCVVWLCMKCGGVCIHMFREARGEGGRERKKEGEGREGGRENLQR